MGRSCMLQKYPKYSESNLASLLYFWLAISVTVYTSRTSQGDLLPLSWSTHLDAARM